MPGSAPTPPFAAGACIGGGSWYHVNPPGGTLSCQPAWSGPSAPGNLRWVRITTMDATMPPVSIQDPDGLTYAAVQSVGPVGAGARLDGLTPAVVQSYQATCSANRQSVGQQPPIVVSFPQGVTAPQVELYEYAPG